MISAHFKLNKLGAHAAPAFFFFILLKLKREINQANLSINPFNKCSIDFFFLLWSQQAAEQKQRISTAPLSSVTSHRPVLYKHRPRTDVRSAAAVLQNSLRSTRSHFSRCGNYGEKQTSRHNGCRAAKYHVTSRASGEHFFCAATLETKAVAKNTRQAVKDVRRRR